jgi:hypothetical protein
MSAKTPQIIALNAPGKSAEQLAAPELPKGMNLAQINPDTFTSVVDYAASQAERQQSNEARYSAFVEAIESILSLQEGVNLACTVTTIADSYVFTNGTTFGNVLFHVAAPGNNHIYSASASRN